MTEKTLWICGQVKTDGKDNKWSFHGVYDTEEKARAACMGTNFFIGPSVLNKSLPLEDILWPGSYYPIKDLIK